MDPASLEFLMNYESELRAMTRPDKAIINNLTMLASDYIDNIPVCSGIIRTVEKCIAEAPPQRKLIPLYVMDSIIKNVGKIFTRLFLQNLTDIFCDAFTVVDNQTRASFIKLLDTWEQQGVFATEKLQQIRGRLALILQGGAAPPPVRQQPAHHLPPPQQPPMGMGSNGGAAPPAQLVNTLVNQLDDRNGLLSIQQQQAALQSRVDALLQMQQGGQPGRMPQGGGHAMMPPPPQQHGYMTHMSPYPQQGGGHMPPPMPPQQHPMGGGVQPGGYGGSQGGMPPPHSSNGNALQDLLQTFSQHQSSAPRPQPPAPSERPAKQPRRTLTLSGLQTWDVGDVIDRLYESQKFLCKSDGRRFRTAEELDTHLDKVFQQNRARKEGTGNRERHWYKQVDEWTGPQQPAGRPAGGGLQPLKVGEAARQAPVGGDPDSCVPAEEVESGARCAACTEELKAEWDSENEQWVFRGVVKVEKQGGGTVLVHSKCFQPGGVYSEPTSPVGTGDTPRTTTDPNWSAVKLPLS